MSSQLNSTAGFVAIAGTLLLLAISQHPATCTDYGAGCTNPQNPAECDTPNTLLICGMGLTCECLSVPDDLGLLPFSISMTWNSTVKRCKSRPHSACSAEPIDLGIPIPDFPPIKFNKPIECQSGECENIGAFPNINNKIGTCSSGAGASALSIGKFVSTLFLVSVLVVGFIGNKILS